MKTTLCIMALLVLQSVSFADGDNESREKGRKRLERIAKEIAERAKSSRYGSRWPALGPVPADILTEPREEDEDILRMYLLARSGLGEDRDKMARILNSPWSAETVNELWKWGTFEPGVPRASIFDLIIYAAGKYKGEVFDEVKSKLDELLTKFSNPEWRPGDTHLFAFLSTALGKYGSLDLLPASFWKLSESNDKNLVSNVVGVLSRIGDTETLKWLKNFKETSSWQDFSMQHSFGLAIRRLEHKLAGKNDPLLTPSRRKKPENRSRGKEAKSQPKSERVPKPETIEKPVLEQPESVEEGANWFAPIVIVGGLVLAGVVVFLLLRGKRS